MKIGKAQAQTARFRVRMLLLIPEVGATSEALFAAMKKKGGDHTLLRLKIAEGLQWLRREGYL